MICSSASSHEMPFFIWSALAGSAEGTSISLTQSAAAPFRTISSASAGKFRPTSKIKKRKRLQKDLILRKLLATNIQAHAAKKTLFSESFSPK
ncbi:hypothetical protein MPLB_640041 [Mesorhizobium sp. ORS 3324]|nr:hypothetical protein MPLB_640041 [Mesorhizobium sp. ORS 3324]